MAQPTAASGKTELFDASLGSLPTLIVPDDPVNGAIEKPKSPPPSARDPVPPQPAAVASARSPREPSAFLPPLASATAAETEATAAATGQASPNEAPPTSARQPPAVGQEPEPPRPRTAATSGQIQMSHTTELAPKINSRDHHGMSKRALTSAKLNRLAGGKKGVLDADMKDIGALGIGMQLYFMLTKYLAITFFIMGIAALPTIVVNLSGNGVTDSMVDPLNLAYTSLGNQGVNPDTKSDTSLCLPKGDIDCTWETVNTPFGSDPLTISWIITVNDVVYSFVFFVFFLFYRYKAKKAIDDHMNENLTPAKYAVFVRGLPADASEKEILDHFNTLYDPTKEELYNPLWLACCWGRRRKVKGSASRNAVNRTTVQNLDHLACTTSITKELYLDTWIAEVSIGHPSGGLLRTFLSMEQLTRSISETQELIQILEEEKRDAPATGKTAFKKSDEKLLQQATKKLVDLNAKLELKTGKIKALKKAKSTATTTTTGSTVAVIGQPGGGKAAAKNLTKKAAAAAKATQHAFDWDACECAFVVFNNVESRRRCLQDYRASTRWLARYFTPKHLRFRGGKHPLIVRPAPEPSNILWENLEITNRGRFYRRSLTNAITFLLLLASCGIISGAQSTQQAMKSKMVTAGFCDYTLPLVFYGNDTFLTKSKINWHLLWDANQTCANGPAGEPRYHIAYDNGIINELHINNMAKTYAASTRCTDPCIAESSTTFCHSMPCFDQDLQDDGEKCERYPETNILYCLCKDAVAESITKYGVFDGPQRLWKEMTPCRGFITDYLTRNVFMYLAAGIVVIVNLLLKAILRAFATFEAHSSESAKASAIAIKMFGAQFLNTAVIVLVVNAAVGLQNFPILGQLFQGKFKDFERDWYPTVGMGITMTMLINAFVPQIVLFIQIFVVAPLSRCLKKRKLRTQDQMNKLYAGPEFDISVRYPLVLNSLFVTMVFCGGSPILLFIASLTAFGTYWFDKLSIIRLYSVKTAYDEELGETALSVLPWTLALHLAFSTWMYGNKELMKSTTIDLKVVLDLMNIDVVDANGTIVSANELYNELYAQASKIDILGENGIVVKVVRKNSMVMFLFFALLVILLLLSTVVQQLLWPIVKRTVGVVALALWNRIKQKWQDAKKNRIKNKNKVHVDNKAGAPGAAVPVPATTGADAAVGAAASASSASVAPMPSDTADTTNRRTSTTTTGSGGVLIPEFTELYVKTVGRKFTPEKKLGFCKNDKGELIRLWQDETVLHGIKRMPGDPMRTWEAMQAPVKSYAIEANSKYRLAVGELVAAAKRLKAASAASSAASSMVMPAFHNDEIVGGDVDAAIAATEPLGSSDTATPAAASPLPASSPRAGASGAAAAIATAADTPSMGEGGSNSSIQVTIQTVS